MGKKVILAESQTYDEYDEYACDMACYNSVSYTHLFPRYWNSSSTMTMRCETSCVRRSNRSSQRSKDACLIRSSSRKSATTPLKVARFWASDSSVARK